MVRTARDQRPDLWRCWEGTGEAALAPVAVPLTRGGAPAGEVLVTLALGGPRAAAALPSGQSVALAARRTNIPGLRWWWVCPRLGHLCSALFLPLGADGFASRRAHGLRHRSESERPAERAARKARKLRRRLGEEGPAVLGGPLPDKPLRMRWPTYERLCDAIREAEDRALSASARMLAHMAAAGTMVP